MKCNVKDNMPQVEFGTTQPNTTITTEEQMEADKFFNDTCYTVGRSTLEWVMFANRDDFLNHMAELYEAFHPSEESKEETHNNLEITKPQLILPN
jgi:hypothetical protein